MRLTALAGLVLCVHVPAMALAAEPAGQPILDEGSPWRMSAAWRTPLTRRGGELKEDGGSAGSTFAARTAPPPPGWTGPDFADGAWSRVSWPRTRSKDSEWGWAGDAPSPSLALLCLRGKFAVEDPAQVKGLTLALVYRGGAAVYVNGQEAARAHLPKEGKVEPETLAEEYPPECFEHTEVVRGTKSILSGFGQPEKYREHLEKRVRRLENVVIDPKLLRKGTNVLAVEIHRAPYFGAGLGGDHMNNPSVWGTCGLVSLALRAEGGVRPNVARPAGIQVWAAGDMHRPDPTEFGNPLEAAEPVSIVGCRNGAFGGRVMISSDKPLAGVKAQAGELKHSGGPSTGSGQGKAVIPAANVKLLYTIRDDRMTMRYRVPREGFWDSFADEPPAKLEAVAGGGAAQSVVLKVRVPADAEPGDYAGKLTVSADGLPPTDVSVRLRVIGWKLPDPKEFATHNGIIQSPDTLAIQYQVPPWSDEHWKLIEESFKLLGELGNKYVALPIVCRTHFGNEQSMIRWVKDGEGYKHDFAVFDRYLDLAQKYQTLDVVCLYAFEMYVGCVETSKGNVTWTKGRKSGAVVTLLDPASGKVEDLEGPNYEDAEAFRKFWGPVFKEVAARLAKRGLAEAMMLGISGDYGGGGRPPDALGALYRELLPGARWVANPHADCRGGSVSGIPVGYNTQYYMSVCPPPDSGKRYYGWQSKTDYHARARGPTVPLPVWRAYVEAALVHNCAGRGRVGADFWPVLGSATSGARRKASKSIAGRYPESDWSQLSLDAGTEIILAPGPRGAMPTENFEQFRQGIQECQARILIEKAILGKKLDPGLARRCQELLDERLWHLRGLGACGGAGTFFGVETACAWFEGAGSAGMAEKLYAAAAEVAAAGK